MSYARPMLDGSPAAVTVDASVLTATIEALGDCAQACTADVDADLSEHHLAEMVTCIRLCLDCADTCTAAQRVITRQAELSTTIARPLLEACVAACRACGDECEQHAQMHAHCRVCEQACRRCEQACRQLLGVLALP
jgi:hypothetical protein